MKLSKYPINVVHVSQQCTFSLKAVPDRTSTNRLHQDVKENLIVVENDCVQLVDHTTVDETL